MKKSHYHFRIKFCNLWHGIRDAFRLWHIQIILVFLILACASFVGAYFAHLKEASFLSNVLVSLSTGIITGIILFIVSQLKISQHYTLDTKLAELECKLVDMDDSYNYLYQYKQTCFPRTFSIDSFKHCSVDEINHILNHLKCVLNINYHSFLSPIQYNSKEREAIFSNVAIIQNGLSKTQDLLDLSFKQNDANGLYKGFRELRFMLDAFFDLYDALYLLANKYKQLQYLLDSKFM